MQVAGVQVSVGRVTALGYFERVDVGTSPGNAADRINVQVEVVDKRETKKADRGIVTYRHRVLNQRDEVVLEATVTRMIRRTGG